MKYQAFGLSLAACALASPIVVAEDQPVTQFDPVVVTATRTETPLKQVGSSTTVITARDIANRRLNTVAEVLRTVPGLDVVRTGAVGQVTSVFVRGAKSEDTLVLIDGIEMNDPASPGNGFNFSDLMVDDIERIEIVRGAQSAIYGSDAIGGVINIITRKGRGKTRLQASGEGGSYDTFKVGADIQGGSDWVNYNLGVSRFETQAFSAADRYFGNKERDRYRNTTVAARLGAQALDNLDLDWTLRFNEGTAHVDDCGGTGCDDPNYTSDSAQLFTRGQGRLKLFDGLWEQSLRIAYSAQDRRFADRPDAVSPFPFPPQSLSKNAFEGDKIKVTWQNELYLHDRNAITAGVESEEDSIKTTDNDPTTDEIARRTANTTGYFLQDQLNLGQRWHTTAGVRFDDNNRFGGKVTWRANQVFAMTETGTRFKASYGTGFKAPSLYQLFAPPYLIFPVGNPSLDPETSRSWDAGLEQSLWHEKILLGASYFNNTFADLIDFSFGKGFQNIGRATSEGVESSVEFKPLETLTLRGNYTYTRTNDDATDQRLLRRPTHKGSIEANYRLLKGADINLNILMVGTRDDLIVDATTFGERTTVPGYVLVNLAAGYQLTSNLKLFARLDNIFDKRYEEAYGYGTAGVMGIGGIKVTY